MAFKEDTHPQNELMVYDGWRIFFLGESSIYYNSTFSSLGNPFLANELRQQAKHYRKSLKHAFTAEDVKTFLEKFPKVLSAFQWKSGSLEEQEEKNHQTWMILSSYLNGMTSPYWELKKLDEQYQTSTFCWGLICTKPLLMTVLAQNHHVLEDITGFLTPITFHQYETLVEKKSAHSILVIKNVLSDQKQLVPTTFKTSIQRQQARMERVTNREKKKSQCVETRTLDHLKSSSSSSSSSSCMNQNKATHKKCIPQILKKNRVKTMTINILWYLVLFHS